MCILYTPLNSTEIVANWSLAFVISTEAISSSAIRPTWPRSNRLAKQSTLPICQFWPISAKQIPSVLQHTHLSTNLSIANTAPALYTTVVIFCCHFHNCMLSTNTLLYILFLHHAISSLGTIMVAYSLSTELSIRVHVWHVSTQTITYKHVLGYLQKGGYCTLIH